MGYGIAVRPLLPSTRRRRASVTCSRHRAQGTLDSLPGKGEAGP